jgi:hypothetical protein
MQGKGDYAHQAEQQREYQPGMRPAVEENGPVNDQEEKGEVKYKKEGYTSRNPHEVPLLPVSGVYLVIDQKNGVYKIRPEQHFPHLFSPYKTENFFGSRNLDLPPPLNPKRPI